MIRSSHCLIANSTPNGSTELAEVFRISSGRSCTGSSLSKISRGIVLPHMPANCFIFPQSVIGMMPGRIGTVMPSFAHRSLNS